MNWAVFWGSFLGVLAGSLLWELLEHAAEDPAAPAPDLECP